jgi:hypothetical protein
MSGGAYGAPMPGRRFLLTTTAVCLFLITPAAASAANRYAEPNGDGAEPCAQNDPCDIESAVNDSTNGDDITLLPGTYTTTVTLGATFDPGFNPKFNITIHGSPGVRPVVNFSGNNSSTFFITTGSVLRDVDVNSTGNTASAVGASDGGRVERVTAHAAGLDSRACHLTGESTIRDSVCWHTGTASANGSALSVDSRSMNANTAETARNVTAVSTTGFGILVRSNSGNNSGVALTATNVFARGAGGAGGADVRTERLTGTSSTPPQQANLDHSNYVTESEQDTGDVTDPGSGTNVTTAPTFVNAGTGDFHQLSTSTGTLNLGTATGQDLLERDIDGQARAMGSAPDIGADELGEAPPAPTITGTDPPSGSNENSPLLIGTSEPFSLVHIFASSDCTGDEAGAEMAEEFASPGIIVSVPDNSTTTFSANAVNGAGTSLCSAPFTYAEVTPPASQPPPTGTTPQPLPLAPAAPKKKCKKKKKKPAASVAKKKCKKKKH